MAGGVGARRVLLVVIQQLGTRVAAASNALLILGRPEKTNTI